MNHKNKPMNEQMIKDLENVKSCLDVAAQKGVFANIDSAYTISVAFNRIAEYIKNTTPVTDGTN